MKIIFYWEKENVDPTQPGDIRVGESEIHLALRLKTGRVAVYDSRGEISTDLNGYAVWVKTKGSEVLKHYSNIESWKARIPSDITEIELISPQGDLIQLTMIKKENQEEFQHDRTYLSA